MTPWELGIKQARGKLSMPSRLTDVIGATGFRRTLADYDVEQFDART